MDALELVITTKLIFSYLLPHSTHSLAHTCKHLHRLAKEHGTCTSTDSWKEYRFWRTRVWNKEMNWAMYRNRIPYDLIFDFPAKMCRYCGSKENCNFTASGWLVDEGLPNDAHIQVSKDSNKLKKKFRVFTHDILRQFPYHYIKIPVCGECFNAWYPFLRKRRRKQKMTMSVAILGRVVYISSISPNSF